MDELDELVVPDLPPFAGPLSWRFAGDVEPVELPVAEVQWDVSRGGPRLSGGAARLWWIPAKADSGESEGSGSASS